MVRVSASFLVPFYQRRQPLDFVSGYNNFINRTVSRVVAESTPAIVDIASQAGAQAGAYSALNIVTQLDRTAQRGGSIGYAVQGIQLAYGQGVANIGGKYVVTNEAGRGGSTSAAKAILSSYNKYRGRK